MKQFFAKLIYDDLLKEAAALSYYTALSLAPIVIIAVTLLSWRDENFKLAFLQQAQHLLGPQAGSIIGVIITNADTNMNWRTTAGILGLFALLFSASAIFAQLRSTLDKIFGPQLVSSKNQQPESFGHAAWLFIKDKIFNMGMALAFIFISSVSLIISAAISFYFQNTSDTLFHFFDFILPIPIFALLFSCIYLFLPSRRIAPGISFIAGILTSILFSAGKSAIGVYIGNVGLGSAYGAAGSLIVLLVWVYYSSIILFFCAEIATFIAQPTRRTPYAKAV